jgi:protein-L-isoaspartate(D-aspartate) O-methyltransferase
MVESLAGFGGITGNVIEAMMRVPRHLFVPAAMQPRAYDLRPLPIGHGQTVSSPDIVGVMSSLLALEKGDKVLEIGTGCGYQTAVLCELGFRVWSMEIVPEVAAFGARNLKLLGYSPALKVGDGYRGWPEEAPFDGCIVTATAPRIPRPLVDQLGKGGRIVLPVREGPGVEMLVNGVRTAEGLEVERVFQVQFVPMIGEVEREG